MKFLADRNRLADAVTNASKACAHKTALNALDGVLLGLVGDKLTVTGYDMEMGIRSVIAVDGVEDGEIVVDAKLFAEMVRRMPSGNAVTVDVQNDKDVTVVSGRIKLSLMGTSGNNFPNILELNDSVSFHVREHILKGMLSQIYHAIAQHETNPALMGARFDIHEGILHLVASDGVRMALREAPMKYDDLTFIVPEKTVLELIRNLSDEEGESEVFVVIDRNQTCFMKENYTIFSRLLEGKFVDYKRIMDFSPQREVVLNVRETISALERTLLLITDKFKSPVVCTFEDEVMHMSCRTHLGEILEDIPARFVEHSPDVDKDGNAVRFEVAFNPRFMIDAMKNSGCDEVRLIFAGKYNPIKVVAPGGGGDFAFIVVPVRLG